MRVTLLQTDIVWEDKQENLRLLRRKLKALRGVAEIVVLPETFSTGFSMDSRRLAEPVSGVTIATLRQWAAEFQFAITGSYIACDEEVDANKNAVPIPDKFYYNRAFFLTPEGGAYYYDKRHLFRMGQETEHFTAGNQRPVISYRGWNILLLVCYDLRFPVWSRNVNNEYDLLIYVANWPVPRRRYGTFCYKPVHSKISVMFVVSTVSVRMEIKCYIMAAASFIHQRAICLPAYPTMKKEPPPQLSTSLS